MLRILNGAAALALVAVALLACKSDKSGTSSRASASAAATAPAASAFSVKAELGTEVKDLRVVAPKTTFDKDMTAIFGVWEVSTGPGPLASAKVKWIAEDVGDAAPKETPIRTVEIEQTKLTELGGKYPMTIDSSLTRPTKGWPIGKYRVELELNGKTVNSTPFTIS
ncbi:MAG: hypothetical protein IPI67_39170 [Myxococcales bacterium]|nr:hypothetical protein [Myxococcales bacterium]